MYASFSHPINLNNYIVGRDFFLAKGKIPSNGSKSLKECKQKNVISSKHSFFFEMRIVEQLVI